MLKKNFNSVKDIKKEGLELEGREKSLLQSTGAQQKAAQP